MDTPSNIYTTRDTAFASFLILKHYHLRSIDYNQPRYEFLFDFSNGIEADASDYFTNKSLVDPSEFMHINRKLVALVKIKAQWENGK